MGTSTFVVFLLFRAVVITVDPEVVKVCKAQSYQFGMSVLPQHWGPPCLLVHLPFDVVNRMLINHK